MFGIYKVYSMLYKVNTLVAMVTDFVNLVLGNSQTLNIFKRHIMEKLFKIKF